MLDLLLVHKHRGHIQCVANHGRTKHDIAVRFGGAQDIRELALSDFGKLPRYARPLICVKSPYEIDQDALSHEKRRALGRRFL